MSNRISKWFGQKLNDKDMFSKTIIPTYSTKVGGFTSILIQIFMAYTASIYIMSTFKYSEINFNKNETKRSLGLDQEINNITLNNGIKFAFTWISSNSEPIDETYGKITIEQWNSEPCKNNTSHTCVDRVNVPLESCYINEFSRGISGEI